MSVIQTKLIGSNVTIYYRDFSSYGNNAGVGRKDGEFIEITNNMVFLKNNKDVVEGIPVNNIIRLVEKPRGGNDTTY